MLDDLREQANDSEFFAGENASFEYSDTLAPRKTLRLFLGMTPLQRFVIAVMVMLMVCVMGALLLLISEKVFLPFF